MKARNKLGAELNRFSLKTKLTLLQLINVFTLKAALPDCKMKLGR